MRTLTYTVIPDEFVAYDGPFIDMGHVQVRGNKTVKNEGENEEEVDERNRAEVAGHLYPERNNRHGESGKERKGRDTRQEVHGNEGDGRDDGDMLDAEEEEFGHWVWEPPPSSACDEDIDYTATDAARYQYKVVVLNAKHTQATVDVKLINLPFLDVKYA